MKFNRNKKTITTKIKKANLAINVFDCRNPAVASVPADAFSEKDWNVLFICSPALLNELPKSCIPVCIV